MIGGKSVRGIRSMQPHLAPTSQRGMMTVITTVASTVAATIPVGTNPDSIRCP
jgi:hypothetical protein